MTGDCLQNRGAWRRLGAVLFVAGALWAGQAAQAETAYGCTGLLTSDLLPSVEGDDGVFFRVTPDLADYHWIGDDSLSLLAQLSRRLSEQGTTLIYLPLPTKAMVMPDHVPAIAADLSYDVELAASVYSEMIERLEGAGIHTLDGRSVLTAAYAAGQWPYLATDARLSTDGTEALARALATKLRDLPELGAGDTYRVTTTGETDLPSDMRVKLQTHCIGALPPARVPVVQSSRGALQEPAPPAIGPDGASDAPIVVLGTEIAVDPALGLAGYISAYSRQKTASYRVTGEDRHADAFAAISSYMTAPGFDANRPKILIWANPVWLNLARYSSRPLRELIVAAGQSCTEEIPLNLTPAGHARADLRVLDPKADMTELALLFDGDGAALRRVTFSFAGADGILRHRIIERHPEQIATGRMVMPLAGLWPDGPVSVDIMPDVPLTGRPRLTLCKEI